MTTVHLWYGLNQYHIYNGDFIAFSSNGYNIHANWSLGKLDSMVRYANSTDNKLVHCNMYESPLGKNINMITEDKFKCNKYVHLVVTVGKVPLVLTETFIHLSIVVSCFDKSLAQNKRQAIIEIDNYLVWRQLYVALRENNNETIGETSIILKHIPEYFR